MGKFFYTVRGTYQLRFGTVVCSGSFIWNMVGASNRLLKLTTKQIGGKEGSIMNEITGPSCGHQLERFRWLGVHGVFGKGDAEERIICYGIKRGRRGIHNGARKDGGDIHSTNILHTKPSN